MTGKKQMGVIVKACCFSVLCGLLAGAPQQRQASGEDCGFRADPDAFLTRQLRAQNELAANTLKLGRFHAASNSKTVDASSIPRKSFIDVEIFDKMAKAGIPSAGLSSDAEFHRRIYLDLTGRIPTPSEIRLFLSDSDPDKRTRLIDRLLYSPEFNDKWAMWMGDLLQNTLTQANVSRQANGRNAYHDYIRASLGTGKPLKDMVYEMLSASGNNYSAEGAASNFTVGGRAVMGPIQDTYDLLLYQTTSRFLGLGHYDCLLCHDGRRHLDEISLWGKEATRMDAHRMAAFFSRVNLANPNQADPTNPLFNSFVVTERATGNYALNTNFGNRPNRVFVGAIRAVDPEYRDGSKPPVNGFWRSELAENIIRDPMLPINFSNRIWKQMFNYALVEPLDGLDPARLDPDQPPPAPWALQGSHPRLLAMLARSMVDLNYDLREFVRLLAESSAYQLSSRYDGEWNAATVPMFARHYARRLEGEEVHDAIVKATGVFQNYTIGGFGEPLQWAVQMPEPLEPRSNGAVRTFMDAFLRGNRDNQQRSQAGSSLQALNLMNDAFVTNRTKVTASVILRDIARNQDNAAVVEEMFLLFLSRPPSQYEKDQSLAHLAKATNATLRNNAVEDLAWTLINKVEFVFSY
ncbi:MAG: DUF1549 domain-containing protein [Acidobacteriia bacterium]|nr:DUF1549 domain-containing protein [Terriglobia bacterium]